MYTHLQRLQEHAVLQKLFTIRIIISFLAFVIIALVANAIYLNFYLLPQIVKTLQQTNATVTPLSKETQPITQSQASVCPQSCVNLIQVATVSASFQSQTKPQPGLQDVYITLGAGQSTASTWQNVAGIEAYINTNNFSIQTAVFEASITIPTGNQIAWVRLYNVTGGYPIWNSEMSLSGGATQYLISPPLTLPPGNNLYQVQMQTQLQYPAILNQSRLHLTVNQ